MNISACLLRLRSNHSMRAGKKPPLSTKKFLNDLSLHSRISEIFTGNFCMPGLETLSLSSLQLLERLHNIRYGFTIKRNG